MRTLLRSFVSNVEQHIKSKPEQIANNMPKRISSNIVNAPGEQLQGHVKSHAVSPKNQPLSPIMKKTITGNPNRHGEGRRFAFVNQSSSSSINNANKMIKS